MIEVNKIVSEVNEKGFSIVENAVDEYTLRSIQLEVDKMLLTIPDDGSYKFGIAYRAGSLEQLRNSNVRETYNFFNNDWMKDVVRQYWKDKSQIVYGKDVFITHDYRNDQGIETNGFVHYDKINSFKFFLYLSDVNSKEDGAFSVVPNSHKELKFHRINQWEQKTTYADIDNKPDYSEEQIMPILGSAGTLIAFDTDCAHRGGLVIPPKQRMIIRMHCWSNDSILKSGIV